MSDLSSPVVSAGITHTCVLCLSGNAKCFGENISGQLGQGDRLSRGDTPESMGNNLTAIDFGTGRSALALELGSSYTCALLDSGELTCFGSSSSFGRLGTPNVNVPRHGDSIDEIGDNLPVAELGAGFVPQQVSTYSRHTCAVSTEGQMKCFGANERGQLGYGDTVTRGGSGTSGNDLPFVSLGSGTSVVEVSAGSFHTCALLNTSRLKCFGYGDLRILGTTGPETPTIGDGPGEMGDNLSAVDFGTEKYPVQVATGGYHTCVLLNDKKVSCFGSNVFGQIGLGRTSNLASATLVDLGTNYAALKVTTGQYHTCVLLDTLQIKCFGSNRYGELGLGDSRLRGLNSTDMGDMLPVVDLGTNQSAIDVSAGAYHTCVVLSSLQVKCFGRNDDGQLGLGDTLNRGTSIEDMGDALPFLRLGDNCTAKLDVVLPLDPNPPPLDDLLASITEAAVAILPVLLVVFIALLGPKKHRKVIFYVGLGIYDFAGDVAYIVTQTFASLELFLASVFIIGAPAVVFVAWTARSHVWAFLRGVQKRALQRLNHLVYGCSLGDDYAEHDELYKFVHAAVAMSLKIVGIALTVFVGIPLLFIGAIAAIVLAAAVLVNLKLLAIPWVSDKLLSSLRVYDGKDKQTTTLTVWFNASVLLEVLCESIPEVIIVILNTVSGSGRVDTIFYLTVFGSALEIVNSLFPALYYSGKNMSFEKAMLQDLYGYEESRRDS